MALSSLAYFDLSKLSSYRTMLMGAAAILIILCHAAASRVLMPNWLSYLLNFGNYGVDIFLFLSGLGCYYSLFKQDAGNQQKKILFFYKKRACRLFPAYLTIFIPLNIAYFLLGTRSLGEGILSVTALEFWFFHRGAWFISLIIPLYLFSPLLYHVCRHESKWLWTIGIITLLTVVCSIPIVDQSNTSFLYNIQLAFSRTPSYILGMAIAQDCMAKRHLSVLWPICLLVVYFPFHSLLPNAFLGWLLVPTMIMLLIMLFDGLSPYTWIERVMSFMGNISLESYLINISLNSLLSVLIIRFNLSSPFFYGMYLQYCIVIVVGTLMAYLVNKLCNHLILQY